MKRKLSVFLGILYCLAAVPLAVLADSRTYTPPAEKGKVYVIVSFAGASNVVPKDVRVSVKWGSWQKSGAFNSGGGRTPKEGVIIRLNHTKNDSVPLTVTASSEARIDNIYQGGEPSQKLSGRWHYVEW